MRGILSGVFLVALTFGAAADSTRGGWGLQFREDTFDMALLPVAMLSEEGDDFDSGMVGFVCGSEGQMIAFFQPGRLILSDAAKAQFRDKDGTKEFTFADGDVPHLGGRLILDVARSTELAKIFEAAAGADVSFRTDKKQGVFTSIGAAETFKIVRDFCSQRR